MHYKRMRKAVAVTEDGKPIYAFNEKGDPICGATSKRSGNPCKRKGGELYENGRCKYHGGVTCMGSANGNFKTGMYSSAMPKDLKKHFIQLSNDEDYLTLKQNISLYHARIGQLLGRLSTEEDVSLVHRLRKAAGSLKQAAQKGDAGVLLEKIDQLDRIMSEGFQEMAIWEEVYAVGETLRKATETEQKLLIAKQQSMATDDLMTLLTAVVSVVVAHVADPKARKAIAEDVGRLISLPSLGPGKSLAREFPEGTDGRKARLETAAVLNNTAPVLATEPYEEED